MKKHLMLALIAMLLLAFVSCSKEDPSSHPQTPKAVVAALLKQVQLMKAVSKQAKKEGPDSQAAEKLAASKTNLKSLFLNPDKARLIMMPLLMIKSENVDFIAEKISGENADVTIEHTITGFGILTKPEGAPPERRQVTFQLQKEGGRWMVSDVGGVLAGYGR